MDPERHEQRRFDDRTEVRTGIVGLGNIGHYHAERLGRLDVPLVGGVDVSAEARDRFRRPYDVDVFEEPDDLFEDLDAVIVTTPNKYHETYAVDALEQDLHVLLEKPLAHDLESAEAIASVAADSAGLCMVGFNYRFASAVCVLRDRIERGELGEITHVEANYVRRRGIPGRGSWFTRREIAGGGALIDIGVHAIDLALYLLGEPEVTEVSGVTRSEFGARDDYVYFEMWGDDDGPDGFDVDDSTSAFVRCADDRTISLEVAWATNRPTTHEFVVHGTEAAATFDLMEGDLTIHSAGTVGGTYFEDTSITTTEADTHTDELRAFFDAVVAGEADGGNVEEALTVQRVVDGIYRSSEAGRTVQIDD